MCGPAVGDFDKSMEILNNGDVVHLQLSFSQLVTGKLQTCDVMMDEKFPNWMTVVRNYIGLGFSEWHSTRLSTQTSTVYLYIHHMGNIKLAFAAKFHLQALISRHLMQDSK